MTFNGYEIPDELRMLRDVVGEFVAREIRPVESALPGDARELPSDARAALQAKARAAGFCDRNGLFEAETVWRIAIDDRTPQ